MKSKSKGFLTQFVAKPKRIFVMDGLGAWLSMVLLYWVLAPFEQLFGMPANIVYVLAGIAFGLFLYSAGCQFFIKSSWKPFIGLLVIFNAAYTLISLVLIILHADKLTVFGWTYFVLELIVIGVIIMIEYKTYLALADNS